MEELLRKKKVLDMMVAMHASLRDLYKSFSLTVDLFLLLSAAILNTLIFIDIDYVKKWVGDVENFNMFIGVFSVLTFLLSLTVLLVKWKERSEMHHSAANRLTKLLNEARQLTNLSSVTDVMIIDFDARYDEVCAAIEPIPQSKFNRLKSRYLRKKEFSKFLDNHRAVPYWLAWFKFYINALKSNH